MAELVSSCRSSRICGRSTFLRNSAPLNAGLFLRRSTQRGHAIGIVFGPLPFDALDRSGELLMTKVVPVEATHVLGPLTPQGTTKTLGR